MLTAIAVFSIAAVVLGFSLVIGLISIVFKIVAGVFHLFFSAIGFVFGAIGVMIGGIAAIGVGMIGAVFLGFLLIPLALPLLFLAGVVWAIRAATRPAAVPATVVAWTPAPR